MGCVHIESMKYELTNITQRYNGTTLRRIRALRDSDLSGFKAGEIGGWVQTTDNLSQEGECWIYHDACVWGNSRVTGDCRISDHAEISGNARLAGFILVEHCAIVTDYATLEGVARLSGYSRIFGHAHIRCGEDGPQILSDVWINFDVDCSKNYAVFSDARDTGLVIAVSQTGAICVASNWDCHGFCGDLPAFRKWAQSYSETAVTLLPSITYWLAGQH